MIQLSRVTALISQFLPLSRIACPLPVAATSLMHKTVFEFPSHNLTASFIGSFSTQPLNVRPGALLLPPDHPFMATWSSDDHCFPNTSVSPLSGQNHTPGPLVIKWGHVMCSGKGIWGRTNVSLLGWIMSLLYSQKGTCCPGWVAEVVRASFRYSQVAPRLRV